MSDRHDPRDADTLDLLRRTFAAHDDVTPDRAADLMERARNEEPAARPRRIPPWLLGVAAGLLAVAVVAVGIVWGQGEEQRSVSVPAVGPTATDGLLSAADERALADQIDGAVTAAGTVRYRMSWDYSIFGTAVPSPDPQEPWTVPPTAIGEIDSRGNQMRSRQTFTSSEGTSTSLQIGEDSWQTEHWPGEPQTGRWEHHVMPDHAGLSMFMPPNESHAATYALGVDDVDGVQARRYLRVTDASLREGEIPAADTPFADGTVSRTQVWVDPATGRLLRAEIMDEDGLITIDHAEYGVDIEPIEAPPADQVAAPSSAP